MGRYLAQVNGEVSMRDTSSSQRMIYERVIELSGRSIAPAMDIRVGDGWNTLASITDGGT